MPVIGGDGILRLPKAPISHIADLWLRLYRAAGKVQQGYAQPAHAPEPAEKAFGERGIRSLATMDIADNLSALVKEGKAQMARVMRSLLRDLFMEAMARGRIAPLSRPPERQGSSASA